MNEYLKKCWESAKTNPYKAILIVLLVYVLVRKFIWKPKRRNAKILI